jgi:hypothetical protein
MHIRSRQMKMNPVNPYSAAAEWVIAGERIGSGGRNLIQSAMNAGDTSSPGEASLLANWMDSLPTHTLSIAEYQTAAAGKDSSFS